ncbi:MAG: metalloregulator ArsR/SmtB family transcription factor [Deltaproteobacteria bacterium]|nr:metalloregulator ArsR/SmtB family transcription factor [Deltaproteobacteria bacterium]
MSDETRLRLISALSLGSLNVGELHQIIGGAQSNVSHHLKILERAGIIKHKKEGTWNYYHLDNTTSPASLIAKNFIELHNTNGSTLPKILDDDSERARVLLEKRRDEAKEFFDSIASEWENIREDKINTGSYLGKLTDLIPDEATIVELGCGSGIFLKELLPRSGKTIGVDYSGAMLHEAEQKLKEFDVELRLGYLEHLPISDNKIDLALAHMVLHHVTYPPDALADIYRIVKKGGKILVVDLVEHNNQLMSERYADKWLGFNTNDFTRWILEAGFCDVEISHFGPDSKVFMLTATKK